MSGAWDSPLESAAATWHAVRRHLLDTPRGLYGRRRTLSRRGYEALWPFACAWSALATLASLGSDVVPIETLEASMRGLVAYHRQHETALGGAEPVGFESMVVPPLGNGGDVFYDDNAWIALALLQHHRLTGDQGAAGLAGRILAFIESGWTSDPSWAHPGGIRWKQPATSRSRNTCSNGPTIEVAAQLHGLTGESGLLEWARRTYHWVQTALRRDDALYADRIDPDGTVHHELWSYNQGTMLGAGVLLHEATGEPRYLDEALATADASLGHFNPETLADQLPAFNAVFLRNLLLLGRRHLDPAYLELALDYGELMWRERRDPRSGLFVGPESVLNHSAPMAQIYALLAGAEPHP